MYFFFFSIFFYIYLYFITGKVKVDFGRSTYSPQPLLRSVWGCVWDQEGHWNNHTICSRSCWKMWLTCDCMKWFSFTFSFHSCLFASQKNWNIVYLRQHYYIFTYVCLFPIYMALLFSYFLYFTKNNSDKRFQSCCILFCFCFADSVEIFPNCCSPGLSYSPFSQHFGPKLFWSVLPKCQSIFFYLVFFFKVSGVKCKL